MVALWLLLWASCALAFDRDKQAKLSEVLERVLRASGLTYPLSNTTSQHLEAPSPAGGRLASEMRHLCHSIDDSDSKTGCCMPTDVRHIYNVKILSGKMLFFRDPTAIKAAGNRSSPIVLPGVKSVKQQQEVYFKMPVEEVDRLMDPRVDCSDFFEGTLHVVGRGTAKNVYHILGDNFAPLAVQMLLDAFVDHPFLHLPRTHLSGFQPGGGSIPHLRLIDDLASGGKLSLGDASGKCFKRVVWGHGAHVLYYDTLLQQRRLMGAFARAFVGAFYKIERPKEFRLATQPDAARPLRVQVGVGRWRPLRVVLYTRGNSGKGRSIQNEELIVEALSRLGAVAAICCDFSSITLEEQIAFSYHSDVVMGLHGAALVHGLFSPHGNILLELKTLYGYTSALFALVGDARVGLHAQVDIRKYFRPGGHKPIDAPLVNRTVAALQSAVALRERGRAAYEGRVVVLSAAAQPLDLVVGPSVVTPPLEHVFGPNLTAFAGACADMALWRYRDALGVHDKNDLHCVRCAVFR